MELYYRGLDRIFYRLESQLLCKDTGNATRNDLFISVCIVEKEGKWPLVCMIRLAQG